jgi:hypothetical protein
MKNEGGQEAGYCQRRFWTVAMNVCLLFNIVVVFSSIFFPFLLCKAQLIGNRHEYGHGEPNMIILHIIRQY